MNDGFGGEIKTKAKSTHGQSSISNRVSSMMMPISLHLRKCKQSKYPCLQALSEVRGIVNILTCCANYK